MKIAKDFRTFNKIKRKYYKRHDTIYVVHINGKKFTSYWEKDDWLGYVVKTYDEYKQDRILDYVYWMVGPTTFEEIAKQTEELYNTTNTVTFKSKDEEYTGYFRGVLLTNRDTCYLLEDASTKESLLIPMHWTLEEN